MRFPLIAIFAIVFASCGNTSGDANAAISTDSIVSNLPTKFSPQYAWNGTLNDGAKFSLWLETDNDLGIAAGEITFSDSKKAPSGTPLLVASLLSNDTPDTIFADFFDEYGNIIGSITISAPDGNTKCSIDIEQEFEAALDKAEFPKKDFPLLAKEANYPTGYYAFAYPNDPNKCGSIDIASDNDGNIRFRIGSATPNIAEADNLSDDAPVKINGNYIDYDCGNCDYGFRMAFFNRFIAVRQIRGSVNPTCFGNNARLDGIYVQTSDNDMPAFVYSDPSGRRVIHPEAEDAFNPKAYNTLINKGKTSKITFSGKQKGDTPSTGTVTGNFNLIPGYLFDCASPDVAKSDFPEMMLATTDKWIETYKPMSVANLKAVPADLASKIEKRYERKIQRKEAIASIDGGKITVFSVQFGANGDKKPLAVIVIDDNGTIATIDMPAFVADDGTYGWNVDDDGTYLPPTILTAYRTGVDDNETLELYYVKNAPESVTCGRYLVRKNHAYNFITYSYYFWVN